MRIIGINAKSAFFSPRTGVEEYCFQLLKYLASQVKAQNISDVIAFYAPYTSRITFADNSLRKFVEDIPQIQFRLLASPYLWTQGRLALELLLRPPAVFFNPEQILPRCAPRKSVITVHDLAYEVYPALYPRWHQRYLHMVTKRAVKKAKRIIAVSEHTKSDIVKYYGVSRHKIEVIYHGFLAQKDNPSEHITREVNLPQILPKDVPYILFVGRIELKKNIIKLIDAYEMVAQEIKKPLALVLAGKEGYGSSIVEKRISYSPYRNHIYTLGYVDNAVKSALYRNSSLFVFPSLYEGFGLPILEAQSFGIPVVASNSSSLPEVMGEGGFLVNPESAASIAHGIIHGLTNKKLRPYVIKKGYQNLERFSWEKTAKKTLNLLLKL